MNAIEFDSVTKTFPDGTVAVEQLSFQVGEGETMVLIGPSGCGKTTTLRLLAGLDYPTAGSIWLGQSDVTQMAPADRNVAMMFQSDALYPHMSVRDNLSFGLKVKTGIWNRAFGKKASSTSRLENANSSQAGIEDRVNRAAQRLGIEKMLDRKPHQLSGGERQRVALGRAMVREPAVFLLDEPLSRLDTRLADEMRSELRRVFRELAKPVLYVTHNQREAMALADRLAVMNDGQIVQVGEPSEIYRCPANLFVANFVGDVPINVFPRTVWQAVLGGESNGMGVPASTETIGVRPEHLKVTKDQSSSNVSFRLQAVVRDLERLGDHALVHMDACEVGLKGLVAHCEPDSGFRSGEQVDASLDLGKAMFFDSSGNRVDD